MGGSGGRNLNSRGYACITIRGAMQEVESRDKSEARVLVATAASYSTMVYGVGWLGSEVATVPER
jgi:hypothetical protein